MSKSAVISANIMNGIMINALSGIAHVTPENVIRVLKKEK